MSNPRSDEYTNYVKVSTHRQWREHTEAPVITQPMTKEEILDFQRRLAESYKCSPASIIFGFEKIMDENDDDRDDCIWLKYKMNRIEKGKTVLKTIFSIKIPVPEKLRRQAEEIQRARMTREKTSKVHLRALPSTVASVDTNPPAKPKLRITKKT